MRTNAHLPVYTMGVCPAPVSAAGVAPAWVLAVEGLTCLLMSLPGQAGLRRCHRPRRRGWVAESYAGKVGYRAPRAHECTAGFEIPQLAPICEAMSHEIKGNFISPEWPSYDGESIFMQDPSFQTPCWRYWVNRQKTSGVKDISWDELHELWTEAFGAVETRAPSNTSVAEIERILHKPARRPTHSRAHRKGSARLSAPTTPFEDRFYSAAKPS